MTAAPNEDQLRVERLDAVIEALGGHPDPIVQAGVGEIVEGLRWLHAEGLGRLIELLADEPDLFRRALDDPYVSNLLLLHDLVVVDERDRTLEALDAVRPLLRGHGGEVELLGVEEGVVRIRLLGACDGCPSSTATLRQGIQRALVDRLPGFRALEVAGNDGLAGNGHLDLEGPGHRSSRESAGEAVSFVPVEKLETLERKARAGKESGGAAPPRRRSLGPLDAVSPGVNGRLIDNYPVLLVRRGAELRAWQNTCPGSILPLHLGPIENQVLSCPWHGCRFDIIDGRRIGVGPPLHSLRVEVSDGEVQVWF